MSRIRIMNPSPIQTHETGEVLVTPYALRDSVSTAYLALATGTKTELIAGVAGYYLDLIQISLSNNSSVAVNDITLSDESTTVQKFNVPVNDTVYVGFDVPAKQSAKGAAWYIDMGDITGTTLTVNAQFVKRTS